MWDIKHNWNSSQKPYSSISWYILVFLMETSKIQIPHLWTIKKKKKLPYGSVWIELFVTKTENTVIK